MPNRLASIRPAARMRELDLLVGTFDCDGVTLATPFSDRSAVKRKLTSRWDLDGHWLFMRIDEPSTIDRPQPVNGNWQITFDRSQDSFVSLWTDNLGRWAVQTSPGWRADSIEFTGQTLVNGRPGAVRDTLVRRSDDEMLFQVEFQVDGAWTRYLESTCRRRAPVVSALEQRG